MTVAYSLRLDEPAARRLADALGEAEALGDATIDLHEAEPGLWEVVAYFPAPPPAEALRHMAETAARLAGEAARFAVAEMPDTDWVARSLAALPPVRAGRFVVHGRHDRGAVRASDIGIEIEAGEAFGTGHHGTTAGCLAALDALGRRRRVRSALDLGTGSGVLAIAMARGWGIPVLATDIDPVATRVAAANVRHNHVAGLVTVATAAGFRHPLFAAGPRFDLVVANILAGPLAALATPLARHLAPGARVVLSGLLPAQAARVLAAYRARGLALERASIRDGWAILVLRDRRRPHDAADAGRFAGASAAV